MPVPTCSISASAVYYRGGNAYTKLSWTSENAKTNRVMRNDQTISILNNADSIEYQIVGSGNNSFRIVTNNDSGACDKSIEVKPAICADKIDNDGDGKIDHLDFGCWKNPNDPNTYDPYDQDEKLIINTKQCSDGIDNDLDGSIDRRDSGCYTDYNINNPTTYDPNDNTELVLDNPQIVIDANPKFVRFGGKSTVTYKVSNPNPISCHLSGPNMPATVAYPGSVAINRQLSGARVSSDLSSTQIFTITCGTVSKSVTVKVVPIAEEV